MQANTNDHYSIDACMELLNSIEDIPNQIYNKAWRNSSVEIRGACLLRCQFLGKRMAI